MGEMDFVEKNLRELTGKSPNQAKAAELLQTLSAHKERFAKVRSLVERNAADVRLERFVLPMCRS